MFCVPRIFTEKKKRKKTSFHIPRVVPSENTVRVMRKIANI